MMNVLNVSSILSVPNKSTSAHHTDFFSVSESLLMGIP